MNLIKVLICLLIIFTGVKLLMDGISIIKNNSLKFSSILVNLEIVKLFDL